MEQIPNCFYRTSAKALILDDQKKFLLVKEDNWLRELPGWGLDFWEDPKEGIKRELVEEMGIYEKWIKENPSYFITTQNRKWIRIANIIYEVQVDIKDVLAFLPSEECQEVKFFNVEEAEKENLFPNVEVFLKHFNPNNH